jgi:hypothetical protein
MTAALVPFADAGAGGGQFQVWLRAGGATGSASADEQRSLLSDGEESRSRPGNQPGSINDGDPASIVVTFDGRPARQDWFAVALYAPVAVRRVVFTHGRNFHDGGWFDTTAGKPQVQVQQVRDGPWHPIGSLDGYPSTTAADGGPLRPGQAFTLRLSAPVRVVGVRVVGVPACGDNPQQAFSSCAELQAFGK